MKFNKWWSGQVLALTLVFLVPCASYAACTLSEATFATPRDATRIVIGPNAETMPLAFLVQPDCVSSTQSVDFSLDGADLGSTVVARPFGTLYSTLGGLALGSHMIAATCTDTTTPPLTFDTDSVFTLVAAQADADVDLNGIPDNPFTTLTGDGFQWLARGVNVATGLDRSVAIVRWTGSGTTSDDYVPVAVVLADPVNPTHKVTVTMPQGLIASGEPAMLVVAMASSPAKLVGTTQAATIAEMPLGHYPGTLYVALDVIISMDGGVTFRTIAPSRIAAKPIHVAIEGLSVATGEVAGIYEYNAGLDGTIKSPLDFVVDGTAWSASLVSNTVYRAVTTTKPCLVEADVLAQGIFSAFLTTSVPTDDDDDGDTDNDGDVDDDDDTGNDGTVTPGEMTGIFAGLIALLVGLMGVKIQDFQNAGGTPCFIATAAFGTPMTHAIDSLRIFRDVFLLDNAFGTAFVDMYYRISPTVADVVAQSPTLAFMVRMVLWPVIWAVRVIMTVPVLAGLISATLIGLSLLKRRKKGTNV